MNPPFSKMTPWARRFIQHRDGVALLPMARARWFAELWNTDATIVPLPDDLKFMKDGKPMSMAFPAILAAYTEQCVDAIKRLGKAR